MDLGLKDKVALITGATRGIGKAAALAFAEEGCHLSICGRTADTLQKSTAELQAKGIKVLGIQADVAKPQDVSRLVSETAEKYGKIDNLGQ